jgi:hypothetical protein
MIRETLESIEKRIQNLSSVDEEKKGELAALVSTLKSEIVKLSETHAEHAESITRFTDLSTHEATRINADRHLQSISIAGLSASVKGFEVTHPRLVEIVNSICVVLSNLGI